MNAVVLQTAARVVMPVMLLLSLVALIRGHNEPGGGFVGGLLAASGFAVHGLAFGVAEARRLLRVDPRSLIGAGLLVGLGSGLPGIFAGEPFMKGLWFTLSIPATTASVKLGTPLLFDIGVYMVVLGITLLMIFALEDARDGDAAHR
ncbi:MAG: Na+/H+ antiporter subunit B [Planctomycetota bacterium]